MKHPVSISSALKIFLFLLFTGLLACGGGGGGNSGNNNSGPQPLATGVFTKNVLSTKTTITGLFGTQEYVHVQQMYLSSNIHGAGRITAVTVPYFYSMPDAVSCPGVTIKMNHNNLADMTSTFASNVQTGQGSTVTVLDNATLTFPAGSAGDFQTILFTTPFEYNGMDNLVFEMERTSACSDSVMDSAAYLPYTAATWSFTNTSTGSTGKWANTIKFIFAGGENTVIAADRTLSNGNLIAPTSTGRTQYLILASDIQGSGPVTGISFKPMSPLTSPLTGSYKITLSHVPVTSTVLGSTFASNTGTSPTVVADNISVQLPKGTSEWWIPMSGSFNYDGTSNLLIDIEATVTTGATSIAYQNASGNRILSAPDTTTPSGNLYDRALEPKLRFNGAPVAVLPPVSQSMADQVLIGPGQVQSLYRNDLLGMSGTIQNVYVRLAPQTLPSEATHLNYKLYMGHTTKTAYQVSESYDSNMTENAVVMSGTLMIPAGLKAGDWVKIPLNTPFAYDPTKNLSILFTTGGADSGGNWVSASYDVDQFTTNSVGRNDNAVTSSSTPDWDWSGIINLKLDLVK